MAHLFKRLIEGWKVDHSWTAQQCSLLSEICEQYHSFHATPIHAELHTRFRALYFTLIYRMNMQEEQGGCVDPYIDAPHTKEDALEIKRALFWHIQRYHLLPQRVPSSLIEISVYLDVIYNALSKVEDFYKRLQETTPLSLADIKAQSLLFNQFH